MKKLSISILFLFGTLYLTAQDGPIANVGPVDFLTEVMVELAEVKSEKADAVSIFFQSFWQTENTFSPSDKMRIEAIYDSLSQRRLNVRNFKLPFISTISGAAANLLDPSIAIMTFLDIVEKGLLLLEEKELQIVLTTAESILEQKALYNTRFYQLTFDNGSVSFDWIDDEPVYIPAEETPAQEKAQNEDVWGSESADGWGTEATDGWGEDDAWGTTAEEEPTKILAGPEKAKKTIYSAPMPVLSGPIIRLKNIDLRFNKGIDSVSLKNTSGAQELLGKTFVGEGGKLTWEHLRIPTNELYASLSKYTFEVNEAKFIAEEAVLNYPAKLGVPVKGLLEYQAESRNKKQVPRFPKFQSYEANYELSFLKLSGLLLTGGVTLEGTTLSSASLNRDFGYLQLQGEASNKFRAKSREFIYLDSGFTAEISSVSIFQRRDSIFHPGVSLDFDVKANKLNLLKGKGGFKKTPFHASYFNIDFEADKIEWELDSTIVDISILIAGNRVPAKFESSEYFNEYRYSSLAGLMNFHPLQLVVNFSNKRNSKVIYLNELEEASKLPRKILNGAMKLLMENGFIIYDEISGRIELLNKAGHYVDSNWGRKDYDNVQITSVSSGAPNGQLDLDKGTLTITGVDNFEINSKLGVSVKPDSGRVVLSKDRDVQFNGTVFAGNYEYVGSDFKMDYDSFLISMPRIDKIKFNLAKDANKSTQSEKQKLQNQLVETAGVLYINKPDNKSAQKEYPEFPIFNATKGATVYFLGEEILGGVYDESLFFLIPPFTIDSVSSSDPNSIAFDGEFHSGGVFPTFNEKLKVMPDKSLGFEHPLPPEGIDLLDGAARFFGSIKLDNQGLRGGKKIEYLSTTVMSDNITFFKDSIKAVGTTADIVAGDFEGASFPDMKVENFDMRWLTSKDSLYMTNKTTPFDLYQATASLDGSTVVSRKGLFGAGELATRGSKTTSSKFTFKKFNYSARNANFSIESSDTIPALAGEDVRLFFNLEENIAVISPEIEGDAAINFPYAAYKTSIPSAQWNLDQKKVLMKKPENIDIRNSYFYSTNPDLDSLVFNATEATYDIVDQSLIISGIPFIQVADARITPSGGAVVVGENGRVNKLFNATLTLDTLTGYHNLYDAEIDILSRNKFEGSATYRYVNSIGDTFAIKMGEFALEPIPNAIKGQRQLRTVSSGNVLPRDRMLLSPGIYYKGDVTMYADKPALNLEGYIQLDLQNIPNYDTWIKYQNDGTAKEVVLDFKQAVTELGNPIQAGLHFDNITNELYATFTSQKRAEEDTDFFQPEGVLSFKSTQKQFVIEDPSRMAGTSYAGKYFAYDELNQKIEFEGPLEFMKGREEAQFQSAGTGSGDLLEQAFIFNILLSAEFDLPNGFTQIIGNDMIEVVQRLGLPEATKDLDRLLPKLAEVAGDNVAKRYEEVIFEEYVPLHALSSKLTNTLTLTNVDFKWAAEQNAWYSLGKLGLSNTGAVDINANIDGFAEIKKSEEGESFKMFLQVSPSCWYFFHYQEDRLIFFSSNKVANELIKKKSKAAKAKFGEFVFLTGDIEETIAFVEDYRRKYYDIDAPYYLEMAPDPSAEGEVPVGVNPTPNPAQPVNPPVTEDDDDGF
ncbi:MAG: hypothetical protein ACI9L9_001557 [Marivirga sp.]|jgi:hypothetical protein